MKRTRLSDYIIVFACISVIFSLFLLTNLAFAQLKDAFLLVQNLVIILLLTHVMYHGKVEKGLRERERKRTEKAIQEREQWFAATLKSIGDAVITTNNEGAITFMNPVAEALTGWKHEDSLGRDIVFNPIIDEEVPAPTENPAKESLQKEIVIDIGEDSLLIARDGTKIPVEYSGAPIKDDTDNVTGFVLVLHDITERKRAEEELRKAHDELEMRVKERTAELAEANEELRTEIAERKRVEEQLRRLGKAVETMQLGVTITDMTGKIIYTNPADAKMHGYSVEELIGKDVRFFAPPESRQKMTLEQIEEMKGWVRESTNIRNDTSVFPVYLMSSLVKDETGNPLAVVTTCEDITERKRTEKTLAEERDLLRTLIDNLPDYICTKDTESRFLLVNTAILRQLGATTPDELIGKTDFDFHSQELARQYYATEQKIIRSGQPLTDYEEPYMDQTTGTMKWALSTKVPLRDSLGEIVGVVSIGRDITQRKQAEEALRESEERFRAIFERAAIGISLVDREGRYIETNPVFQTMLGYSKEELRGMAFIDITYSDDVKEDMALHNDLMTGRLDHFQIEKRYIRKDGHLIWARLTVSLIRDVGGETRYDIGMVEDITERKRAEEELRKHREHLKELVEERTAELTAANNQLRQEIIERKQAEKLLQQRNRELALLNRIGQIFSSTIELNQVLETVLSEMHRLLHIAATSFWVRVPETGELVCQQATGSERETVIGWRLTTGQGLVGQAAQTGKPVIVADSRSDTHHYKGVDQKTGVELRSFMGIPFRAKGEVTGVLSLMDTEVNRFTEDDLQLVEPIAAAAASAVDNARLYLQAQQEIAERKQAEEELRHAKEAAEFANRAKSEFLANMSHELRTPLNAIMGYAQILKTAENLTERQVEGLDTIKSSGQHLLNLINEILDLSKIEAGRMELELREFHLPEFLTRIAEMMRIRAEQEDLLFVYECESDLPEGTRADEKKLRQILINLIGNAIKFTEEGEVSLRVYELKELNELDDAYNSQTHKLTNSQTHKTHKTHKTIHFEVEDTGVGIAADRLEEIFLPFQQVGEKRYSVEGTGLGLAISRKLVRMMGSELMVESTPGKGSIFWFDLNLPEISEFVPETKPIERKIIGYKGEQNTILVADDRKVNRTVVVNMLLPVGFKILEAENGQECLEKALKFRPDAILLDLRMPVMDGFEAARELRKLEELRDGVVIAISASAYEETRGKSLQAGCDDFLTKPIQLEKLLEVLQIYLKLEWIYEEEQEQPALDTKPHPVPASDVSLPEDQVKTLIEFASKGRVKKLLQYLPEVEDSNQQYQPFIEEIRQLVKKFQFKEIIERLKHVEVRT